MTDENTYSADQDTTNVVENTETQTESSETAETSETAESAESFTPPIKEEPKRIVTMEDGSTQDFGKRAKLTASYNVEDNTVTFKVITGEILLYTAPIPENTPEFIQIAALYGFLSKIKSGIGTAQPVVTKTKVIGKNEDGSDIIETIEVHELANTIKTQIDSLKEGKFTIRSSSEEDGLGLTIDQEAWALARIYVQNKKEWSDSNGNVSTEPHIVEEIQQEWDNKSRVDRNKIRKNQYFAHYKAQLLMKEVSEVAASEL
jgi:hypothetical protein